MSIRAYHLHGAAREGSAEESAKEGYAHEVYEIGKAAGGIRAWVDRFTQKNVLIIGRDLTLHVRQKYPPASDKALAGIVANHAADLFPMPAAPGFSWRVFQRHKNYVLADVWAWDKAPVEDFRARHGLDYVVPEDMLFSSAEPQITVFRRGGKIFLVAHGPGGFIGATTVAGELTERHMALFMKSLGRMEPEIRKVENLLDEARTGQDPGRPYPPPIDRLAGFRLTPFRAAALYASVDTGLVFRAALYAVASYVFAVYLSVWSYDGAIARLRNDNGIMDEKLGRMMMKSGSGSTAARRYKKLVRQVRTAPTPFDALDVLVVNLPKDSFIRTLTLDDKNVSTLLITKNPTQVINILRANDKVESVEVVEPFHKDQQGNYNFTLVFNLKGGS